MRTMKKMMMKMNLLKFDPSTSLTHCLRHSKRLLPVESSQNNTLLYKLGQDFFTKTAFVRVFVRRYEYFFLKNSFIICVPKRRLKLLVLAKHWDWGQVVPKGYKMVYDIYIYIYNINICKNELQFAAYGQFV